jgi:toxin ParE1/3/4
MSEFRLSPEAGAELDGIWIHMARASGSIDIATRVVESITERFWLLARYPYMGRRRDDLRPGLRSFTAGDYVIVHRVVEDDVVLILHVVHGSRDICRALRSLTVDLAFVAAGLYSCEASPARRSSRCSGFVVR